MGSRERVLITAAELMGRLKGANPPAILDVRWRLDPVLEASGCLRWLE